MCQNRLSGGQYWTPITPLRGSNLHAETHQIATYCAEAGANTDTTTSVDLGNGKTASGSIHCAAADLTVSSNAAKAADEGGSEGADAAENGVED